MDRAVRAIGDRFPARIAPGGIEESTHHHRRSKKTLGDVGTTQPETRRERGRRMKAVEQLAGHVGTASACRTLAVSRASFYRQKTDHDRIPAPRSRPTRALNDQERHDVLDVLRSDRFVDKSPGQVYATLLDEGVYHCSVRTMYRVLAAADEGLQVLGRDALSLRIDACEGDAGSDRDRRRRGALRTLFRRAVQRLRSRRLPIRVDQFSGSELRACGGTGAARLARKRAGRIQR